MASAEPSSDPHSGGTRRDFLNLLAGGSGSVFVGLSLWPFIDGLNPAEDTLALSSVDVSLEAIEQGMSVTVLWRGKPVFIRHRTPEMIAAAQTVDEEDLPDPQSDLDRTKKPQWLILVGVCTHLGCIPKGQKLNDNRGEFGGWFCPCHGSHYDTSGRIRKGPAPKNLMVPDYNFLDDTMVKIG